VKTLIKLYEAVDENDKNDVFITAVSKFFKQSENMKIHVIIQSSSISIKTLTSSVESLLFQIRNEFQSKDWRASEKSKKTDLWTYWMKESDRMKIEVKTTDWEESESIEDCCTETSKK